CSCRRLACGLRVSGSGWLYRDGSVEVFQRPVNKQNDTDADESQDNNVTDIKGESGMRGHSFAGTPLRSGRGQSCSRRDIGLRKSGITRGSLIEIEQKSLRLLLGDIQCSNDSTCWFLQGLVDAR
ncbi:hypothetical protein, partial [Burkholderia gladioli]|uniref:hypothetical protein n=1 Tax=Burkholderia gladioli TaxID=28095 RepID=UPI001ABBAF1C